MMDKQAAANLAAEALDRIAGIQAAGKQPALSDLQIAAQLKGDALACGATLDDIEAARSQRP